MNQAPSYPYEGVLLLDDSFLPRFVEAFQVHDQSLR